MRVIHNASLIIMAIDIFKKQPIHDAVILCNGRQNPYIKKDDGYYIFCDLQPDLYNIEIFSPGYVKKDITDISELYNYLKNFMGTTKYVDNVIQIFLINLKNGIFK